MIVLDLQLFAKSAAYQKDRRISKARKKYEEEAKSKPKEENKPAPPKKHEKGDIVSAVRDDEKYEIYKLVEGKEEVVRNKEGKIAVISGKQIRENFTYNKNREGWVKNNTSKKFIIRKRK